MKTLSIYIKLMTHYGTPEKEVMRMVDDFFRFLEHGSPSLVIPPSPPLFGEVTENPYDDPNNPPTDPEIPDGFCAIKWSDETDPETGNRKYHMQNFSSEAEVEAAGFHITHLGHCAACSSLQDLGVYMSRNLTSPTR